MPEREPDLSDSALAAAGLRELAAKLARDTHEADDLAQDAWLRALELRPWRRGPLEPWLARVLRNLALFTRRSSARREERERAAARPEAQPSSAELVARAELRRELVAHLTALREPYREALLLRYLEELPPRAIARRLGVPVGTVHTRITRGLELLRARLSARRGGLLAFVALARPPARRVVQGGVWMLLKKGLGGAALALVTLFLTLVALRGAGLGPGDSSESALLPPPRPAQQAPSGAALAPSPVEVARATPGREAGGALRDERALSGRVLYQDRRPAPGVTLSVLDPAARFVEPYGHDANSDTLVAELRTDAEGRFRVPLERGRPFDLALELAGFARERRTGLYAGEQLELVLRPELRLAGTVRFEDGAPVAGAEVRVRAGVIAEQRAPSHVAATDADGRYELRGLAREPLYVRVSPPGYAANNAQLVPPELLPQLVHDVLVPRGATLRGRVTGGENGEPLAGARVGVRAEPLHSAVTGEDGRYELVGMTPRADVTLCVDADGYGCFDLELAEMPAEGLEQDFFLLPGRTARGRVVDTSGEPVAGARVLARLQPTDDVRQIQRDERRAASDAEGRFELTDLRADLPHSLLVQKGGLATTVLDLPADEWQRETIELGDVVMARPARLAGRLLDPAGAPLADLCVLLTAGVARRPGEWPTWYREGFGAGRMLARTDARGRYAFADLPPGRYYLSAGDKGWARRAELTLELAEGDEPDDVDLVLDPGLALAGVLVDAHGTPLVGEAVFAIRPGLGNVYNLTRAGGRFALHGLEPGELPLRVWGDGETHEEAEWRVEAGRTDLRLVLERCEFVELAGRVLTPQGEPVAGCMVFRRASKDLFGTGERVEVLGSGTKTDATGRFAMRLPAGRCVDLRASLSSFDADGDFRERYTGELRGALPGDDPITLVLRQAPLGEAGD